LDIIDKGENSKKKHTLSDTVWTNRLQSESGGNCETCLTSHFTTLMLPLRKAAINTDTARLSSAFTSATSRANN